MAASRLNPGRAAPASGIGSPGAVFLHRIRSVPARPARGVFLRVPRRAALERPLRAGASRSENLRAAVSPSAPLCARARRRAAADAIAARRRPSARRRAMIRPLRLCRRATASQAPTQMGAKPRLRRLAAIAPRASWALLCRGAAVAAVWRPAQVADRPSPWPARHTLSRSASGRKSLKTAPFPRAAGVSELGVRTEQICAPLFRARRAHLLSRRVAPSRAKDGADLLNPLRARFAKRAE